MAIVKNVTITIKNDTATLSEDIYAYLGDGLITILITILEPHYKFGSFRPDNLNVVDESDALWASVCVLKPDGTVVISEEKQEILDGKVMFKMTKDLIDDIGEEGVHQLQIHLFDDQALANRLTIPPVPFHILKPICDLRVKEEDEENNTDTE